MIQTSVHPQSRYLWIFMTAKVCTINMYFSMVEVGFCLCVSALDRFLLRWETFKNTNPLSPPTVIPSCMRDCIPLSTTNLRIRKNVDCYVLLLKINELASMWHQLWKYVRSPAIFVLAMVLAHKPLSWIFIFYFQCLYFIRNQEYPKRTRRN